MTATALPVPVKLVSTRETSLPALIEREKHRRIRRRWVWSAIALVVVGAGVATFFLTRPRPVAMSARFRTAPVLQGDLVREVRATGYVEAVSTVSVGAEISGRVATVETDYNQPVKAGQVLARFDITALEAQRVQSAAMSLNALAQLKQAKSDLAQTARTKTRADALFAQAAMPVSEHEAAVTALSVAQSRVAAGEASLAAQAALATVARSNLDHAVIRAPIDGIIITRNIDPGQTVASMLATPVLFTVAADLRKMEVLASIDEADIAQVEVGQSAEFTVTAWQDRIFKGQVTEVRNAARVVQDVVTYAAVIEVSNLDLALKPGMTASVRVRTGKETAALQVSAPALRFTPPGEKKGDNTQVWTLEGEKPVAHAVHPGMTDGEQTVIGAGELPVGSALLLDLTVEGKKAYGLAPK